MAKIIRTPVVTTLTVQGKQVTPAIIAAYGKRIGSIEDILSVWANAATLQVAVHGNRKWIDALFTSPALTLKAGGLSKQGKEVLAYIQAHCPRVQYDKDSGQIGLTKLVKESILATHFVHPTATAESETVIQQRNKFYMPHGDFALTLNEFRNIEKEVKEVEDKAPQMTAKAFAKQAEKALECFENDRFVGTPEELFSAMTQAKALFLKLDAAHTKAEAEKVAKLAEAGIAAVGEQVLDTAKLAESLSVKASSKSRAAGGKVIPEMAATA